ncbi:MAG: aminotransferase class V-fold PLP-dependent enzyme [Pirellulaceae bacterium]
MTSNHRVCLLNPGPVTLSRRVRESFNREDLCHRDPDFSALQADVRERIRGVYEGARQNYEAVLLTGSGTAAVEAMVGSLVPTEGRALVVANGIYGERMATMLQIHKKDFAIVTSDSTEPINLAEVDRILASDNRFTHVLSVHHETTTGRLNDIAGLGAICRQRQVALLLDTVSSFAGEELKFEEWNLQACAATANKCLHGVPGVAFVLARRDVLESPTSASPCLYLDLFRNYKEQIAGFPMFTPSVQATYALQAALHELEDQGGWKKRRDHYRELSRIVREGLKSQSYRLLLKNENDYSSILTSFLLPSNVAFEELFANLKDQGYVIYSGQRALNGKIFRIAVMGDLSTDDMQGFVGTFKETVANLRTQSAEIRSHQQLPS